MKARGSGDFRTPYTLVDMLAAVKMNRGFFRSYNIITLVTVND